MSIIKPINHLKAAFSSDMLAYDYLSAKVHEQSYKLGTNTIPQSKYYDSEYEMEKLNTIHEAINIYSKMFKVTYGRLAYPITVNVEWN
ncbi:hypothetical protein N9L92_00395 [Saprospiraceae bacterium]|nr:hypothetical protein [Saprospiraceae bacterium]